MSVDPKAPTDDYIGEPDYPGPYATKRPLEGLRDTDEARIVCLAPDVCLKQVGSSVVPVPFQIHDLCGHDENYTSSVRFTGQKAMVMRSRTSHCHGDAEGDRLGIVSGTIEDVSEPITNAGRVRAEGSEVITHLDKFKMNNGNTVGEAQFVRDTRTYEPPEDDDPVPGSLRLVESPLDEAFGEPIELAYAGDPADFVRSGEGTTAAPERRTQTGNPARRTILRRLGYLGLAIELVFFGDDVKRRDNIRQFERLAGNPAYSDEAQAIFGEIARDLRRTTGWNDMQEAIDRGLARAEQLERDGRFRRPEQEPEEDPKPVPPPPVGNNVRVDEDEQNPRCRTEIICFMPGDQVDRTEFERQMELQEDGLNRMSPGQMLANRQAYLADPAGMRAQSSPLQQQARTEYRNTPRVQEQYRQQFGRIQGPIELEKYLGLSAALHNPDMIAGGAFSSVIDGSLPIEDRIGTISANSSMGSQWINPPGPPSRAVRLATHAERQQHNNCPSVQVDLRICPSVPGQPGKPMTGI